MGDITVINGGVRGFATGINLLNGSGSSVERVRASSNVRGIDVEGMASGNTATSNAEIGIVVRDGTVSGNTSNFNGFVGILVSCPGSIVDNTAVGNGSTNLFTQNPGCVLANNAAP